MAKAEGNVMLEGSLNNMTFYKKNGKNFVRRKGGVSKERIATDPNYVRTRENNNEFSLCTAAGKTLRLALGSLVFKAKDNRLSGRMLQDMYKIKNFDTVSPRGQRQVNIGLTTPEGKLALAGFDFNANARLNNVLFAPYELDIPSGKVTIADLIPLEQLLYPQGATNVGLQCGILGIDFETGVSELVVSNVENLPINLTVSTVSLTPTSVPVTTGVTLFLMMISFYQEVNGVQYSLKNEAYDVVQIIEVV